MFPADMVQKPKAIKANATSIASLKTLDMVRKLKAIRENATSLASMKILNARALTNGKKDAAGEVAVSAAPSSSSAAVAEKPPAKKPKITAPVTAEASTSLVGITTPDSKDKKKKGNVETKGPTLRFFKTKAPQFCS